MLDLSIIIVSYNTKDLTLKCLESVFRHTTGLKFEVIVVDNASADGTVVAIARKYKSKVILIKNKENIGFGAANNQGMSIAQGRYFCLLNSDTSLIGNLFEKAIDWFDKRALIEVGSAVGVVGVKLLNPDRSEQESYGGFPTLPRVFSRVMLGHFVPVRLADKMKKVDYVKGACMILKREVFERVGGFDAGIFMYVEEVEWNYRIHKAGYSIVYWPQGSLIHYGGASSPDGQRAIFKGIFRGYRYFYAKHFPQWQLSALEHLLKVKAKSMVIAGKLFGKQKYVEVYQGVLDDLQKSINV